MSCQIKAREDVESPKLHCPTLSELPQPPRGKSGWPWTVETAQLAAEPPDEKVWPRVSIVTPSYNQGQFIEETIRSVLLQGYPNLEYFVVDGGSTDESVKIIKKYEPWLSCWISERDEGQSDAINKGFSACTGEILGWLNSDDFFASGTLKKVIEAFADNAVEVGAVVGIGHKIDSGGQIRYSPLPSTVTRDSLLRWCNGQNFMQPACFFTKEAWIYSGPLRLDLNFCMDLALWLKMSEKYNFKIINESLAFIHSHSGAKTIAHRRKMFGETALLLASQPDGWASSKELLFQVLDEHKPVENILRNYTSKVLKKLGKLLSN